MIRAPAYLVLLAALAGCAAPADGPRPAADTRARCAALAGETFDGATVTETETREADAGLPAHCRVRGIIDPRIRYEARLPLADWNGKYYQSGCGGYCGQVLPDKPGFSNTINEALKLGYAAITTDGGHEGWLGDASWAEGDPEAVEVYAHRGIPLTHRFGTALARAFYGEAPAYDYFGGCSNGGRMAAMAAQRYPMLFDGILGGAAVLKLSTNGGVYGSWVVQANTRGNGERILTRANFAQKLPALEAAVLGQCDAADGSADGLIGDPRACAVDISALPSCSGSGAAACFTAEEKAVLARWYQGPRDSAGRQLYPGMPPGSERYWFVWFLDPPDRVAPGNALGGGYARYLGFPDRVGPGWTALDFDFDRDPAALAATAGLFDATDPDLSAFRDAGGKLLMWHGWADPLVLPDQSADYFRSVAAANGGGEAAGEFFRLFMIPGHGHCWELPAAVPDRFNPIRVLEGWVERGIAPESIVLSGPETDDGVASQRRVCRLAAPTGTAGCPGDASARP